MKKLVQILTLTLAFWATGCASSPKKVAPPPFFVVVEPRAVDKTVPTLTEMQVSSASRPKTITIYKQVIVTNSYSPSGQVVQSQPQPQPELEREVVYAYCDKCDRGYRSCFCGSSWKFFKTWGGFYNWYSGYYGHYPSAGLRSVCKYSRSGLRSAGMISAGSATTLSGGMSSAGMSSVGGSMQQAGTAVSVGRYYTPRYNRFYGTTTVRGAGVMVGTGGVTIRQRGNLRSGSIQSSGGFLGGLIQIRTRVGRPAREVQIRQYHSGAVVGIGGVAGVSQRSVGGQKVFGVSRGGISGGWQH